MLKKLLKYEYRASMWLIPFLFLAAALLYGAGWAAKAIGIGQLVTTFGVSLLIVGIAGIVVAVIMVIVRYYKGMFGAEGYLNQSLPVGKGPLLASRFIVGFTMVVCGIVLLFAALLGAFQLLDMADSILAVFRQFSSISVPLLIGVLVLFLIQLLLFIAEVYFAVTLANTRVFLANNLVFAVVFYFVANITVGVLEVVGLFLLPLSIIIGTDGIHFSAQSMLPTLLRLGPGEHDASVLMGMPIGLGSILVDIVLLVVLLAATRWLLARKTSVK